MNKNLRKVMAFALVLVMAVTTFGPIAMAENNFPQPNPQDLVNQLYGRDTGFVQVEHEGCIKTYSVSFKVTDSRNNLLGYHLEQVSAEDALKAITDTDALNFIDKVKKFMDLGILDTNLRVKDIYKFELYKNDNGTETLIDAGFPNEFGILNLSSGNNPFVPGAYLVKYVDSDGNTMKVASFEVPECGFPTGNFNIVLPAKEWCYSVRTVKEGLRPAANKDVSLYKLQTQDSGNGYKYVLKEDKTYRVTGNPLVTVTTNNDGYAELFDIQKKMDSSGNQVKDPKGFKLWDVYVPGNPTPVATIREGEFLGTSHNGGYDVYVINPWKMDHPKRVDGRDPAVWPVFDYEKECGANVTIPYGESTATLRVRVFHADEDAATRLPVPGAVVGLYKNASQLWGPIVAGDELARGTTDENGIVEFYNVPLSDLLKYFGPVTNNAYLQSLISKFEHDETKTPALYGGTPVIDLNELVTEGSTVVLPYLFKQLSAPEGFSFDEGELYPAIVQKADLNNTKFVEIRNYKDNIGRIAGGDRYETAIAIANKNHPNGPKMFDNFKTVILADGNNFADALVGGVLASQYDSPLLLTNRNGLTKVTKDYLLRHKINRVIVLGGEYSVTPKVLADLVDMDIPFERVYGDNRAETAVKVGENVIKLLNDGNEVKFNKGFTHNGRVFLAYEGDFADALTASVPASEFGTPILLTATNKLSPETAAALKNWGVREVVIVGGPNSVSESVATEVRNIANITVHRYYGLNRATTAMEIAKHYYHQTTFAYVASGEVFPDALTGAPLAAKKDAPILLVNKDKVPEEVANYIANSNITQVTILGGPNTVSNAVRAQLNAIMVPGGSGITTSN